MKTLAAFSQRALVLQAVVADAWRHQGAGMALVLMWGIISVSMVSVSLGGFFLIVNGWIEQKAVNLFAFELPLAGDVPFTLGLSSVLLIIGVVGARGNYAIERRVAHLAARFQQDSCLEVLTVMEHPAHTGWQGYFSGNLRQGLADLFNTSIRLRSLVLRQLLQLILPVFTFGVALVVMFVANPMLSLLVCIGSAALVPAVFTAHTRTAQIEAETRHGNLNYQEQFRACLREYLRGQDSEPLNQLRGLVMSKAFLEPRELFLGRFVQKERLHFLNSAFMLLMLYGLLVFFVAQAGELADGWKGLLVFAVAFRFCVNSFQAVVSTTVTISRLFAGAERYHGFMTYSRQVGREPAGAVEVIDRTPDATAEEEGEDIDD